MDFQSHYKNIPVENVIEIMKELAFGCQNVIQNAHFIIALLDMVLKNRLMSFQKQYFMKNLKDDQKIKRLSEALRINLKRRKSKNKMSRFLQLPKGKRGIFHQHWNNVHFFLFFGKYNSQAQYLIGIDI